MPLHGLWQLPACRHAAATQEPPSSFSTCKPWQPRRKETCTSSFSGGKGHSSGRPDRSGDLCSSGRCTTAGLTAAGLYLAIYHYARSAEIPQWSGGNSSDKTTRPATTYRHCRPTDALCAPPAARHRLACLHLRTVERHAPAPQYNAYFLHNAYHDIFAAHQRLTRHYWRYPLPPTLRWLAHASGDASTSLLSCSADRTSGRCNTHALHDIQRACGLGGSLAPHQPPLAHAVGR